MNDESRAQGPASDSVSTTDTPDQSVPEAESTASNPAMPTFINRRHERMLAESGITTEHAKLRGYHTINDGNCYRLAETNIVKAGRITPGLLIPLLRPDGSTWGYQYRPDKPRLRADKPGKPAKPVKYETPWQQRNGLDVPPGVGPKLEDPTIPLWITEGAKKVDCGALHGLCVVGLIGVWNWLTTSTAGGKLALAEFRGEIALNGRRVIIAFDGDVARKEGVQKASNALASQLAYRGAKVEYLHLPDTDDKTGLDDYLGDHSVEDLWRLVKPTQPRPVDPKPEPAQPVPQPAAPPAPAPHPTMSLNDALAVFRKWLGDDYDANTITATLAAVAAERLDGDPLWLLVVSGPGNAKTETVQAASGAGAVITSAIASEAALLSATPQRERSKTASGGLLRKIGDRGVLVIKDVTTILEMNRERRAEVLSALREIYDGHWYREVGTDGGQTIEWAGRIAVVGAVTTAWDRAHAVISTMGDRFVLIRSDSSHKETRLAAGRSAIRNTGNETQMRSELSAAVGGVIAGIATTAVQLTEDEQERLLYAADLVTRARTGVDHDNNGRVINSHAPEMPTRFAKQLAQVVRGAVAIGVDREAALELAIRCARDSVPPLRIAIIDYLADQHPQPQNTSAVRKGIGKPWSTTDRELQGLHMLGVLDCDEDELTPDGRTKWFYTLGADTDPSVLKHEMSPVMSLPTPNPYIDRGGHVRSSSSTPQGDTDKSGDISGAGTCSTAGCDNPLTRPAAIASGICHQCRNQRGIA